MNIPNQRKEYLPFNYKISLLTCALYIYSSHTFTFQIYVGLKYNERFNNFCLVFLLYECVHGSMYVLYYSILLNIEKNKNTQTHELDCFSNWHFLEYSVAFDNSTIFFVEKYSQRNSFSDNHTTMFWHSNGESLQTTYHGTESLEPLASLTPSRYKSLINEGPKKKKWQLFLYKVSSHGPQHNLKKRSWGASAGTRTHARTHSQVFRKCKQCTCFCDYFGERETYIYMRLKIEI